MRDHRPRPAHRVRGLQPSYVKICAARRQNYVSPKVLSMVIGWSGNLDPEIRECPTTRQPCFSKHSTTCLPG
jgi:hypothetical protein